MAKQVMVRALKAFSLGGGVDVQAGDVFEVDDNTVARRVNQGQVEVAPRGAKPQKAPPYRKGVVVNRDPATTGDSNKGAQ